MLNADDYDINCILFIKNVYPEDCISDDLFEKKLLDQADEQIHQPIIEINQYNKLPHVFINIEEWPKHTILHCWNCDLTFENIPIFIPKTSEISINGVVMGREGCFCSFNCALAYINLYYHKINDNINKRNLLNILFKRLYNKPPKEIIPAPSKYEMIHYGGSSTISEYREKIKKIQKISGIDDSIKRKWNEEEFKK